ncbi:MAG: hypothetical protein GXP62_01680 [Oligoflexia bacterium]|nr:hypothetical protein [Oligoflexia bacterium]
MAVLARATLLARPLGDLDGLTIPDDAYYCLDLARNIALGAGASYGGVPTNGFQPLYVLLLTPFFLLTGDNPLLPLRLALGLLCLLDLFSLVLIVSLVRRHSTHAWAPLAAGGAWALSPYVLETATNGMETALATLLMLALLWTWDRALRGPTGISARTGVGVGLLAGLAVLGRIDATLVGPALALDLGLTLRARQAPTKTAVRFCATAIASASLVLAPWLAWSWTQTGMLFPVSGRAVRFMSLAPVRHAPTWANWYRPMLETGADAALTLNANMLIPLAIIGLALLFTRRGTGRPTGGPLLRNLVLLSATTFLAYTLYIFGPWFFRRYLFPLAPASCIALGLGLDALLGRIANKDRRRSVGLVAVVAIVAAQLGDPAFARLYTRSGGADLGYMDVGMWVRGHFPPGTVIGAAQSGAISYLAPGLTVVNLDGVVSQASFRALQERRQGAWIDAQGVQYIVGMKPNFVFLRDHAPDLSTDRLVSQGRIPGVRSLYQDWFVVQVLPPGSHPSP